MSDFFSTFSYTPSTEADRFMKEGCGCGSCECDNPYPVGTEVVYEPTTGYPYKNAPDAGMLGSVVSVKTASGERTGVKGRVFVRWADGKARPVLRQDVKLTSQATMIRMASLGDLSDFLKVGNNQLIHKSTQDLWSLKQSGDSYTVERLFDDQGKPIKV